MPPPSSSAPAYMAPEQFDPDQGLGPDADLYAFGCMLLGALTGEVPFRGSREEIAAVKRRGPGQLRRELART